MYLCLAHLAYFMETLSTSLYMDTCMYVYKEFISCLQIEELDINIKSTQGMIVKNFCRHRNKFCHEVLGEGDKFAEDRLKILKRVIYTRLGGQNY